MTKYEAKIFAYLTFSFIFFRIAYFTITMEGEAGFWQGIVHGFFILPRIIFEIWKDYSAYIEPHETGYTFGVLLGILLAALVQKLYVSLFLIWIQIVIDRRL